MKKLYHFLRGAPGSGATKRAWLSHVDGDKSQQKHKHGSAKGQDDRHHGDDVFDGVMFVVFRVV
jgi:hypothetical protein